MSATGPTWKEVVERYLRSRWTAGEVFGLNAVYQGVPRFQAAHPQNTHLKEKVRQTLQLLREDGVIQFLDNQGSYRLRK